MPSYRIAAAKGLLISAVLLSLAASPARPDTNMGYGSEAKKLCYCGCDTAGGTPMCHHLCELPKYEHRSWATSCHTAPQSEINQSSPAQPIPSKRTNRIEHARLN